MKGEVVTFKSNRVGLGPDIQEFEGVVVSEPYAVNDSSGGYYATFVVVNFQERYRAIDIDYLNEG